MQCLPSIDEEIKTDSGIILSGEDASQFRYKKGKVIKPGTDVTFIKEGDVVYYDKGYSFTMIIGAEQQGILNRISAMQQEFYEYEKMLIVKYGQDSVINLQTGEVTQK